MLESKKDIVYVDLLSAIMYPNRVVIKANQNILMRLLINEDTRSLLQYIFLRLHLSTLTLIQLT